MECLKLKISNNIITSAHSLRRNNIQKRILAEIVTDILKNINQELVTAHRNGCHNIITTIPITFNVNNMSNTDSQRHIYSSIIAELISKNYRIWISPGKNECRIKITWMSPEDETEINEQMQLIVTYTKPF